MTEEEQEKTPYIVNPWVLPENSTASGVITFYHNRRKWGRISQTKDEGSPSIFFHLSALKADTSRGSKISLKEGYGVSFTAVKGDAEDERLKASDVELDADAKANEAARLESKEARKTAEAKARAEAAAAAAAAKIAAPKKEKSAATPKSNKREKVIAKEDKVSAKAEKAVNVTEKKERIKSKNAAATADTPQLVVNITLVGEFEGARQESTVNVNLDADRFLSSLKKKACRKLNLKTSTGLEMFLEIDGSYESVKYEDFKKFKDGDSCKIQIRASTA